MAGARVAPSVHRVPAVTGYVLGQPVKVVKKLVVAPYTFEVGATGIAASTTGTKVAFDLGPHARVTVTLLDLAQRQCVVPA